MVRYPMGGMSLYFLSFLAGLVRLGHEVFYVEKLNWEYGCHDLEKDTWTNDPGYGIKVLKELFQKYGINPDNWCFVDAYGKYYGHTQTEIEAVFKSADLFFELEWREWEEESQLSSKRVYVDGEPGWSQINFKRMQEMSMEIPTFDHYITTGLNIRTAASQAPDDGIEWKPFFPPVLHGVFDGIPINSNPDAAFTTVMNWRANKVLEYEGQVYGQKAEAFHEFIDLPSRTDAKLELAVSGKDIPFEELKNQGWKIRDANQVSRSVNSYLRYLASSAGEFSVAKQIHSQLWDAWTGDRMAYYLQAGKPVVHQDTGFSSHIPTGRGLLAVNDVLEAADAISMLQKDSKIHAMAAKEIAYEYFDAEKVLQKILRICGY